MPAGRRGRGVGVSELPLPAPSPHARQDVLDDRSCQEGKSRFVNVHPTPARAALPVSQRTKLRRAGLGRSAAGAEAWLERPTWSPSGRDGSPNSCPVRYQACCPLSISSRPRRGGDSSASLDPETPDLKRVINPAAPTKLTGIQGGHEEWRPGIAGREQSRNPATPTLSGSVP